MTTHDVGVAHQGGRPGSSAFWGYCSCGWSAPGAARGNREAAQADADEHLAVVADVTFQPPQEGSDGRSA